MARKVSPMPVIRHFPGICPVMTRASHYESLLDPTTVWDNDTINVFGILKYHQFHGDRHIFMDSRPPLQTHIDAFAQIDQPIQELPPEVNAAIIAFLRLPNEVASSIVTVAAFGNHCVVLQLKLHPDNTTVVYDCRPDKTKDDLNRWSATEEMILKRCGINRDKSKPKWLTRYYHRINDLHFPISVEQTSESDCGPIACRILWQLLRRGEADQLYGTIPGRGGRATKRLDNDVDEWRKVCVTELISLVEKHRPVPPRRPTTDSQDNDSSDDESKQPKPKRSRLGNGTQTI